MYHVSTMSPDPEAEQGTGSTTLLNIISWHGVWKHDEKATPLPPRVQLRLDTIRHIGRGKREGGINIFTLVNYYIHTCDSTFESTAPTRHYRHIGRGKREGGIIICTFENLYTTYTPVITTSESIALARHGISHRRREGEKISLLQWNYNTFTSTSIYNKIDIILDKNSPIFLRIVNSISLVLFFVLYFNFDSLKKINKG